MGLTVLAVPSPWQRFVKAPLAVTVTACATRRLFHGAPPLRFLAASKGLFFAVRCFPLVLVYNLTCAVGLIAGLFHSEVQRDRWLLPTLGACGVLIIGLQISGGAYHAESDAMLDEVSSICRADGL